MSVMSGASDGETAYGNGAFYMGQGSSEGNSQSFVDIQTKGAELQESITAISDIITTKTEEASQKRSKAQEMLGRYEEQYEANENRIAMLYGEMSDEEGADNSGIEAEIARLEAENAELKKKMANCELVISALGSDMGILSGLAGNVSSASSALG